MKAQFLALTAALLLASLVAHAQTKVALYSFGEPGQASYEQLSFWAKAGKRTDIYYVYGADRKQVRLKYLGKTLPGSKPGFRVQFTNGHMLAIVPSGLRLAVSGAGQASKSFAWEYEGPVDGIGTFCEPCAADEKEAMQVLRTYYLK